MNRTIVAFLVGALFFVGCLGPIDPPQETPVETNAGAEVALGQTTTFLALASACSGAPIGYSYSGTSFPGYLPARDGQITAQGEFTAPICGSPLLGSTVTVVGSCLSGSTPYTAVANIIVGAELVTGVIFLAADVSICGAPVCRANDPQNIFTPPCQTTPTAVDYYIRIDASCGSVMSPMDPMSIIPLPPSCPPSVSP